MVAMVHTIPLAYRRRFWITSGVMIIAMSLRRLAEAGKYNFFQPYFAFIDSRDEILIGFYLYTV